MLQVANAEDKRLPVDNSDLASGPIIGIDFGTSYSRVSVMRDGNVHILADEYGRSLTASTVDCLLTRVFQAAVSRLLG